MCFDCASGRRFTVSPEAVAVLAVLDGVGTPKAVAGRLREGAGPRAIEAIIRELASRELVMVGPRLSWPWSPWMPEAAFFHFGTRASRFPNDPRQHDRDLRTKALSLPPPVATKVMKGNRVPLPAADDLGSFTSTLRQRRTWRNFSTTPVRLPQLSTLLQLTFGVQHHARVKGQGTVVLKTSPSGGARHPLEAYVLCANVSGLERGVYHYDAGQHQLVSLGRRMSRPILLKVLANQDYFANAGAVIVMAAVFERSMWKYASSRAYRAILIDAGHLGQTFCLAATAMKLAPFCTMAFRETVVDELLGLDGIRESAMYIVGVGTQSSRHQRRPGRIPDRISG